MTFTARLAHPIEFRRWISQGRKRELYLSRQPLPRGPKQHLPALLTAQGVPVNAEKLAAHLQVDRYGDFWLTEAVRPSLDLQVVPREGFRVGVYRDAQA